MNDNVYRGIKRSQPSTIRGDKTVTSALFKDEHGVSVDMAGGREQNEIIGSMKDFFDKRLKGIVELSEKSVDEANACIIPAPTTNNPYHAEIYKNFFRESLTNLQCLQLADACRLIYFDENIKWT